MKFKATWVAMVALSLFGGTAAAAGKYYVGYEQTQWDVVVQNNTTRLESDAEGQQLHVGFQPNENFAVEITYGDNDDFDETYYGIAIRPQAPITTYLNVSAIFGVYRGDLFDGTDDFSWGFGLEFAPTDMISITGDWIHYVEDSENGVGARISGVNFGVRVSFGGEED